MLAVEHAAKEDTMTWTEMHLIPSLQARFPELDEDGPRSGEREDWSAWSSLARDAAMEAWREGPPSGLCRSDRQAVDLPEGEDDCRMTAA
jgi:hypothetical protein